MDDPNFRCIDVHNVWYANQVRSEKKLDLNDASTFDFLISGGLDVNKVFVYACQNNNIDIVSYLIEIGADMSFNDDLPIKTAVKTGHLHLVKYLFEQGSYQGRNNDTIIKMSINGTVRIFLITYLYIAQILT